MPEDLPGGPPVPTDPALNASAPSGSTDADVAQGYFDNEISRIHGRLDELQQAMAHLVNSQEIGHGGHRTEQSQAGTPAQNAGAAISADASAGGESVSGAAAVEPEHAPAPSHWWWRSLHGR